MDTAVRRTKTADVPECHTPLFCTCADRGLHLLVIFALIPSKRTALALACSFRGACRRSRASPCAAAGLLVAVFVNCEQSAGKAGEEKEHCVL